mmetsp:Transcript_88712/g.171786  ORF Transcript_88712/g.171786 Transcript_88712/m.171786 type:complete len:94 (+) Transcript_88712:894-1175(+)
MGIQAGFSRRKNSSRRAPHSPPSPPFALSRRQEENVEENYWYYGAKSGSMSIDFAQLMQQDWPQLPQILGLLLSETTASPQRRFFSHLYLFHT